MAATAIVTYEFEGLTFQGGIGVAYRRLAELLAANGHRVTVVFVPFYWSKMPARQRQEISARIRRLRAGGIDVEVPEAGLLGAAARTMPYLHDRSWLAYQTLRRRRFDVVHFPDSCGVAYHSLLARKAGLDFQKTVFIAGAHGSQLWTAEANAGFPAADLVALSELDRASLEMADELVSPSRYMLRYLASLGWRSSRKARVIPNVNDLRDGTHQPSPPVSDEKGLVFFGRLEPRKGVFLFTEALEILLAREPSLGKARPLKVVYLGRERSHVLASVLIRDRLRPLSRRLDVEFLTDFPQRRCGEYLAARPNYLACMPSLLDNSPYVIVEALERGLNFLACDAGGQAELIDSRDRASFLCRAEPQALADALLRRLAAGPMRARPSRPASAANARWLRYHQALRPRPAPPRRAASRPLVTVALGLSGNETPSLRAVALRSLKRQDYRRIEVLVAGKDIPAAAGPERWLKAARSASGKYILFLDGGSLAAASTLSRWVGAAERFGSDHAAISGLVRRGGPAASGERWQVPAAADPLSIACGLLPCNVYALWRRDLVLKYARHGWDLSGEHALGPFCAHAHVQGARFAAIPEAVVRARPLGLSAHWGAHDHLSRMRPLLEAASGSWRKFIQHSAAAHHEIIRARIAAYHETVRARLASRGVQRRVEA